MQIVIALLIWPIFFILFFYKRNIFIPFFSKNQFAYCLLIKYLFLYFLWQYFNILWYTITLYPLPVTPTKGMPCINFAISIALENISDVFYFLFKIIWYGNSFFNIFCCFLYQFITLLFLFLLCHGTTHQS